MMGKFEKAVGERTTAQGLPTYFLPGGSTSLARRLLTPQGGRDVVLSTWCGYSYNKRIIKRHNYISTHHTSYVKLTCITSSVTIPWPDTSQLHRADGMRCHRRGMDFDTTMSAHHTSQMTLSCITFSCSAPFDLAPRPGENTITTVLPRQNVLPFFNVSPCVVFAPALTP